MPVPVRMRSEKKGDLVTVCTGPSCTTYSVILLDRNSFWGDVVLDRFNKASRDKEIFNQNAYYNTIVSLKPNFMSSLLLCAAFLQINIFFNQTLK